jgi:serpin B
MSQLDSTVVNRFGNNLYQQLSNSGSERVNTAISALSLFTVLLMTSDGARGETLDEMRNILGINGMDLKKVVSFIEQVFQGNSEILYSANAIFLHERMDVKAAYLKTVRDIFHSELHRVQFKQPDSSRQKINSWVEEKTKSKIKDLLPPGSLNELTRMILVNAIYFKADWKDKFDKNWTKPAPFFTSENNCIQVDTMFKNQCNIFYNENEHSRWIHLPYTNEQLMMVIMLPKKRFDLDSLQKHLLQDSIPYHQATRQEIKTLALPKFKFTFGLELTSKLKAIGIKQAFSSNADFGNISEDANLYIDLVYQKVFIQVDEEGTEAVAATAVIMKSRSLARHSPIEFIVDQPFIFLIVHKPTNITIFQGQVHSPTFN